MTDIVERLSKAPVVPLVQANDPAVAVAISKALVAGGLSVLEVVFRTEQALKCMEAVLAEVPDAITGAGTVLTADQAQAAVDAGAQFLVSPGLDDGVVGVAQANALPMFPGIATASELQRAVNLGLQAVKFFPASLAGGPKMIKALGSAFGGMRFMPTGGVSPGNLNDYLALPQVLACGGSWLTPKAAIEAGDFDQITTLAREALAIATQAR